MSSVSLSATAIFAGSLSLLLWPAFGPYSLLLYPLLGSMGAAAFALMVRTPADTHDDLKVTTDELVAELRRTLENGRSTPIANEQAPERRNAG